MLTVEHIISKRINSKYNVSDNFIQFALLMIPHKNFTAVPPILVVGKTLHYNSVKMVIIHICIFFKARE